jgi:hypothetical protein
MLKHVTLFLQRISILGERILTLSQSVADGAEKMHLLSTSSIENHKTAIYNMPQEHLSLIRF